MNLNTGTCRPSPGLHPAALAVDGYSSFPTTAFGIAAWVKITPTENHTHVLFVHHTYSSYLVVAFGISDPAGGLYLNVGSNQCISESGAGLTDAADGLWHHVVITWVLSSRTAMCVCHAVVTVASSYG